MVTASNMFWGTVAVIAGYYYVAPDSFMENWNNFWDPFLADFNDYNE
jgi:hypothetical protein